MCYNMSNLFSFITFKLYAFSINIIHTSVQADTPSLSVYSFLCANACKLSTIFLLKLYIDNRYFL